LELVDRIEKSNQEWQDILTPEQYRVARLAGTEPAFTGKYHDLHDKGIYKCVCWGTDEKGIAHPGGPFYQGDKHIVVCIRDQFRKTPLKVSEDLKITKPTSKVSSTYPAEAPNKLWDRVFGGTGPDYGWSVDRANDDGYIIASGEASFGAGGYDAWLIKTDANGNKVWDKTFGGTYSDWANSVNQTKDGGYIITGGIDFDSRSNGDLWLLKIKKINQSLP
jgi:hypothetical protein